LLLLLLSGFIPVVSLPAQTVTTVAVATLGSGNDERSLTIANETTRALETILAQLEGYTVSRVDAVTERTARRISAEYDFLIYGSVEDLDGITRIDLTVFSRAADAVTQSYQRDISSAFELFDAAEEAAVELLEALSGTTIRFGTVTVRNDRSEGAYYLVIDGQELPGGPAETRVLIGARRVQVVQNRMIERYILFDQTFQVEEGASVTVDVSIPRLTTMERRVLLETEEQITTLWDDPDATPQVVRLFDRLELLLDEVSYSPELAEEREEYRTLRSEFETLALERGTPPRDAVFRPGSHDAPDWIVGLRVSLGPEVLNDGPMTEELSYPFNTGDDIPEEDRSITIRTNSVGLFAARELFSWVAVGAELGYSRTSADTEVLRDQSADSSGLDLNGRYQRIRTSYRIESAEMSLYVEPRVPISWGISALLRLGPQFGLGTTVREAHSQNFDSGTETFSSKGESRAYSTSIAAIAGAGLRYERERYGVELVYLVAPITDTLVSNVHPILGPRTQIQLGAYWRVR
jgi:hypothetical protein